MNAAFAAVGILVVTLPALGADDSSCRGLYKSEYATLWELSSTAWDAACASGRDPAEILASHQQGFMRACAARFEAAAAAGRTHRSTVSGFCAQGVEGRRQLLEQLEPGASAAAASSTSTSPTTRASEWKPEGDGMGPFVNAIEAAKRRWGPTACLCGLEHTLKMSRFREGDDFHQTWSTGLTESFTYCFRAKGQEYPRSVAYADEITSYCERREVLKGPNFDGLTDCTCPETDCLGRVEVDLAHAMKVAQGAGLQFGRRDAAILLAGRAYPQLAEGIARMAKDYPDRCKPLSNRQSRLAGGKDVWVLWAGGKMAVVDAEKGRLLGTVPIDYLCLPVSWPGCD